MNVKNFFLLIGCIFLSLCFTLPAISTDQPKVKPPSGLVVIKVILDNFQTNADYRHKKSIVVFAHTKHIKEYKLQCGQCHHDDQNQPLNDLQMSDDVQKCIECHSEPGERPKGKDAPRLSKEERLAYHAEAMHYNCKECHKAYNKEHKTKAAPTTCSKCHPKKK